MFKHQVQGFAIGAAFVAAIMVGMPALNAPGSSDIDGFVESLGVTIVWTEVHPCLPQDPESKGCFATWTPDVIYVNPTVPDRLKEYTILHEVGHVLQYRRGAHLSECRADQMASLLGAAPGRECTPSY